MLTRLLAGTSIAAFPGLVIGIVMFGSGLSAHAYAGFAAFLVASVVLAVMCGGPPACLLLFTVLRRANPWKVWPAGALGATAGMLVTFWSPLWFGELTFAFSALAGGLGAAVALRIWLATPYRTAIE